MVVMPTASQTASVIRLSLKDVNDFPGTSSDSPLKVSTYKGMVDDKKALAIDATYRRRANPDPTYQLPIRTIANKTLTEVFDPLVSNAVADVATAFTAYQADPATFPAFEAKVEVNEYVAQLYGQFKTLSNAKVLEVSTTGEIPKTLILVGETGAGTTEDPIVSVYAATSVVYA